MGLSRIERQDSTYLFTNDLSPVLLNDLNPLVSFAFNDLSAPSFCSERVPLSVGSILQQQNHSIK